MQESLYPGKHPDLYRLDPEITPTVILHPTVERVQQMLSTYDVVYRRVVQSKHIPPSRVVFQRASKDSQEELENESILRGFLKGQYSVLDEILGRLGQEKTLWSIHEKVKLGIPGDLEKAPSVQPLEYMTKQDMVGLFDEYGLDFRLMLLSTPIPTRPTQETIVDWVKRHLKPEDVRITEEERGGIRGRVYTLKGILTEMGQFGRIKHIQERALQDIMRVDVRKHIAEKVHQRSQQLYIHNRQQDI